jgi:hypothetical protein
MAKINFATSKFLGKGYNVLYITGNLGKAGFGITLSANRAKTLVNIALKNYAGYVGLNPTDLYEIYTVVPVYKIKVVKILGVYFLAEISYGILA